MAATLVLFLQSGAVEAIRSAPRSLGEAALRKMLDGLIVVDPLPDHVSVVAVHGGGGAESLRERPAAALLLSGRADHIVAMGGQLPLGDRDRTYAGAVARRLSALGVNPERIVRLDQGGSTLTELRSLRDLAIANGWTSIALSTSRWHTRRVHLSAQRAFQGTNLEWSVIAAPDNEPELAQWWKSGVGMRIVFGEWIKTGALLTAGRG